MGKHALNLVRVSRILINKLSLIELLLSSLVAFVLKIHCMLDVDVLLGDQEKDNDTGQDEDCLDDEGILPSIILLHVESQCVTEYYSQWTCEQQNSHHC